MKLVLKGIYRFLDIIKDNRRFECSRVSARP